MSISAAHFNEVTNGYEKQSDGLWVHKGKLSVGPPGTSGTGLAGDLSVNRGSNMGAIYFGGMGAAQYIYWNGTAWQFQPGLTGAAIADGSIGTADLADGAVTSVKIADGAVAAVDLADGAVTTPKLAANAAQQLLGSYRAVAGWTLPGASVWYETNVQVTVATGGGTIRLEACGTVLGGPVAQSLHMGLGVDGGVSFDGLGVIQVGTSGYIYPYSIVGYLTIVGAGTHRFSVFMFGTQTGGGLSSGTYQTLWVTEQKR